MISMWLRPVLCAAGLALAGCASIPAPLQRPVEAITPAQSSGGERTGATVRWGGRIVETRPLADRTCFDMVGYPLDASARPIPLADAATGRFVACKPGFYDPEIFAKGRELTLIGRIDGTESRTVGEYAYRQPRVAVDTLYLWPERPDVIIQDRRPPYLSPWWGYDPWPFWRW